MPRGARLDTPGTLHHVILRGIEKRDIVDDDTDRENFITRMGNIALETGTSIYAWALMTNHAHILLKSGSAGLPTYMRRFLSGYAVSHNRRHNRYGHLFQNRYKSIICEEEPYFKDLVRYIHLNPLRAGIVKEMALLDRYKWCGHSVVMNRHKNDWQNRKYVLKWFGKKEKDAKRAYRAFVKKGIDLGKRPDLTGGGLIRSMGGWSVVKAMRKSGIKEASDDRILGSGEFVSKVISQAEERIKYQLSPRDLKKTVKKEIEKHCRKAGITSDHLMSGSRLSPLPQVRKDIAIKLVHEYGVSLAETARHIGISTSGVGQIIKRERA
jgi:REP element-mobilizing transposase RayT